MIVDPSAARVGLADGSNFDDFDERIVCTWETEVEGVDLEIVLAFPPKSLVGFVTAVLNGLGFPEGDLEYIAERYERIAGDS